MDGNTTTRTSSQHRHRRTAWLQRRGHQHRYRFNDGKLITGSGLSITTSWQACTSVAPHGGVARAVWSGRGSDTVTAGSFSVDGRSPADGQPRRRDSNGALVRCSTLPYRCRWRWRRDLGCGASGGSGGGADTTHRPAGRGRRGRASPAEQVASLRTRATRAAVVVVRAVRVDPVHRTRTDPPVGGAGGVGVQSSITGTALWYAGGGGGQGLRTSGSGATGGAGGSGVGGGGAFSNNNSTWTAGTAPATTVVVAAAPARAR